jgi:cyclic pyranopterin phosphate synthase
MTLTHFDPEGRPKMVDVSAKAISRRTASSAGYMVLCKECSDALSGGQGPKGDPWSLARISAISGVKHAPNLLPLAHPLLVDAVNVSHHWDEAQRRAWLMVEVSCEGRTGAEMEAIVGVCAGLAGLYDALKAISHQMEIGPIKLLKKDGGRSGALSAPWPDCPWQP